MILSGEPVALDVFGILIVSGFALLVLGLFSFYYTFFWGDDSE